MKQDQKIEPIVEGKPSDWFKKIAIIRTDVKRKYFPTKDAYVAEFECIERSEQVQTFLQSFGIEVKIIPANEKLSTELQNFQPELCFNFTDSVRGSSTLAASVPGLLDLLGISYVGSGPLALSFNTNKYLTKQLLEVWDIPTPRCELFRSKAQVNDHELRFPLIAKLNEEHGSVGIDADSVVSNQQELKKKVSELIDVYHQAVLVEEYIEGEELTGVVLETKLTRVFVSGREFPQKGKFKVLTFDTKWSEDMGGDVEVQYVPHNLPEKTLADMKADLRSAFDVLRMDDFARFDIILDKYGNYYIVDSNANPSFGPMSSLVRAMQTEKINFEKILFYVMQRNKLDKVIQSQ